MAYIPSVATLVLLFGQSQVVYADSTLSVSQVTGTGTFPTVTDSETWPVAPAGWSFARTYTAGGSTYVVLLRQHTGDLEIYDLTAGAIGSRVSTYNLRSWWTSAEVITPGGVPTLVLHDADTGSIRTYVLNSTGSLGARSDTSHPSWIGKNLFTTYQRGSTWYFHGLDTRTGSTTLYTSTGTAVPTNSVTPGWTAIDHVKLGADTFRVLYKGGDFPGNEGGRLAIDRIDASGNSDLSVYTESASEAREGWTTVKFYTAGGNTYLLFYGGSTSTPNNLRLERFTGAGLVGITESPLASGWTDLEPYTISSNTYMLALNEEGVERINGSEIDTIVLGVQAQLDSTVFAGYQFALAQSGRVLYEHAYGKQDVINLIPMTVDVQMSLASMSKIPTAMSVLKLADMGELDLDTPVPNYLDYDGDPGTYIFFTIDPLFAGNTPRDFLLHTTGISERVPTYSGSCGAPDLASTTDLSGCLGDRTGMALCGTTNPATGNPLCPRSYANANYNISRGIIEYISLTEGTIDFVAYVQELWMERVGMGQVDCMAPLGSDLVMYQCTSDKDSPCTSWTAHAQSDSENCGSGGWKANPREMLRLARTIRYQHVLGPELSTELMNTNYMDANGNVTRLGWDTRVSDDATAPETFLCKPGGASGALAELCVGSKSVDLYIAMNNTDHVPMPNVGAQWVVDLYNVGN